jgi:uncharacterized protein YbjT (DUF2867 family)
MSVPSVLITGATGKTGKLLARELLRRGVHVRAGSRSVESARKLLPGVEVVAMDYRLPETVRAAMKGMSRVYLVTPGGSEQVEQAWIAVEAARQAGVEHITKLGSLQPGRGPVIQVERWCRLTEEMVERSGIGWTHLRPTWFNQNFTEYIFAPQVKLGLILAPIGEGRAGWIDCRDIADVAAATLADPGAHAGKAYTLTGPELLGMAEIVAALNRASGRTIRYHDSPTGPQRVLARLSGMPARDVDGLMELLGKLKENWLTDVTADVERVLGRPAIRFEKFAQDSAAALRR